MCSTSPFSKFGSIEGGANRVSASRLAAMADTLGVPISFFSCDLTVDDDRQTPAEQVHRRAHGTARGDRADPAHYGIPGENVRQPFLQMVVATVSR